MKININVLLIFSLFVILLFLYSLHNRIPHGDDAWIGEQVYWLDNEGIVKNVLLKNYNDNQNELLVYHKAFIYNGLLAVKLFGFSLPVLKSISLFYLLLFLGIFYYYLVILHKFLLPKQFLWVAVFIIIEPHIFEYSFVYRPEIMLMVTGFLSYIFLEQSRKAKSNNIILVLFAAVFSGLSLLVHLNGLLFVISGAIILLFYKQVKNLILFTIVNIGFVYLYFAHLNSYTDIIIWAQQILSYESGKVEGGFDISTILNYLLKIVNEHLRFLHSPKEITLSLLLIIVLVTGYKKIKIAFPILLPYTLLLMLSLGFFVPSKTAKYLIPLMPFFALMIITVISSAWKSKSVNIIIIPQKSKSIAVFVGIILFLASSLIYDVVLVNNKFNPKKYSAITNKYIKTPTNETTILAPMLFIFNEISKYKEVVGLISFNERQKTNPNINGSSFFNIAENESIDYIILNQHYIAKFNVDTVESYNQTGNYKVVGFYDGLTIFELKREN